MSAQDKTRNAIIKASALLVAFIFGLIGYNKITTSNFAGSILQMFEQTGARYSNRIEYQQQVKDSLKLTFSGFWVYTSPDGSNPRIDDRIQLKDNGIVWQVNTVTYYLPSKDSASIMNVVFGLNEPFSPGDRDTTMTVCNFVKIRQVWIQDGDTCYGENTQAGVWMSRMEGDSFLRNGRIYRRYEENDLTRFYPAQNLTPLVDKIDLPACPPSVNRHTFSREKLNRDLADWGTVKRDVTGILTLINEYFVPFCFTELPINEAAFIDRSFIDFEFDLEIASDGSVANVKILSPGIRNSYYLKLAEDEVRRWRFGPTGTTGLKLTYRNGIIVEPVLF